MTAFGNLPPAGGRGRQRGVPSYVVRERLAAERARSLEVTQPIARVADEPEPAYAEAGSS